MGGKEITTMSSQLDKKMKYSLIRYFLSELIAVMKVDLPTTLKEGIYY